MVRPRKLALHWLLTPTTRPERFAKAVEVGADALIIDLEDAVAPKDKDSAREVQFLGRLHDQESVCQRLESLKESSTASDRKSVSQIISPISSNDGGLAFDCLACAVGRPDSKISRDLRLFDWS
jgi:HpcH/HpaI aldolase/citrate lyase family